MGMKKLKKAAMIAAASMFVMMVPMIQTHAAPTDVIENNESGIPDKVLYQNILKEHVQMILAIITDAIRQR